MKELSKKLASFDGLYISGTFIDNGALVTALALLFEKVYLPQFLQRVAGCGSKSPIDTHGF